MATSATTTGRRPPPWRDVRVLRVGSQVVVGAAAVALVAYLYDNLTANQRALGIETSFDFLDQQAGFDIAYTDFRSSGTVLEAMLTGLRNTLTVALLGVAASLVVGTVVGVARLSGNWLIAKVAGTYVEVVRNVPPLLCVIFVNSVALTTLPEISDPARVGGLLLLSVREVGVAVPRGDGHGGPYLVLLAVAVAGAVVLGRWRSGVEARTGRPARRWAWGGALVAVVAVAGWFALDAPVVVSRPEVTTGLSIDGGTRMGLPLVAVLVGLVLYTSTHVAEIVRGSIMAVPRGQTEAAEALGLSAGQRLRLVVLPQAFRVAVPPLVNQALNLTKNTSLGVAVGYSEAMYVTNAVIASGGKPAIQTILVVMGMYLVVSLAISLV
ncbi:MAG TPA: ABC transporter permease subunit, partial [Acidimicrobiales bacterium]|nr:ABC transporter permease subunit [Acidimicrobiales bacterium]